MGSTRDLLAWALSTTRGRIVFSPPVQPCFYSGGNNESMGKGQSGGKSPKGMVRIWPFVLRFARQPRIRAGKSASTDSQKQPRNCHTLFNKYTLDSHHRMRFVASLGLVYGVGITNRAGS